MSERPDSQEWLRRGPPLAGNAFTIVEEFERRVADFTGAPHAVAVDCCTSALFLCCVRLDVRTTPVRVPCRTYVSVPMAVLHAGGWVEFEDREWSGIYDLSPYPIWDAAKRFRRHLFAEIWTSGPRYVCLSFHVKKHLPIGRGGMILTDDVEAASWFRRARYDGRRGVPYRHEVITQLGWHMYMTPEQAARGLYLLDVLPDDYPPDLTEDYPDLRLQPVFQR